MENQRFANLLHDDTFKIVIGAPGNEPLIIKILELLIPGKRIRELTFLDKENHGMVLTDKKTTFDLLCKSETDERFIVEMQFEGHETFKERMLVYSTYPIRLQMDTRLRKAEKEEGIKVKPGIRDKMDYSLNPVYVVSLLSND